MQQIRRILISVLAIAALAVGATVASADRGGDKHRGHKGNGATERLFTIQQPDPAANPEGIAVDKRSRRHHGRRRHLPRHARHDTIVPFIDAAPGKAAIPRQLYVAGRPDRNDHGLRPRHRAGGRDVPDARLGGFLNDLVVTRRGDVYVTDSLR